MTPLRIFSITWTSRSPTRPACRSTSCASWPAEHVTVVLSGEGADEIYAGYEWYADTPLMQKYKRLPAPLRHLASDVSQQLPYFKGHDFIIKGSGRPEDWFIGQAHVFEEKDAYDILRPKYRVGPTAREVAAPIYDRVKDLRRAGQRSSTSI